MFLFGFDWAFKSMPYHCLALRVPLLPGVGKQWHGPCPSPLNPRLAVPSALPGRSCASPGGPPPAPAAAWPHSQYFGDVQRLHTQPSSRQWLTQRVAPAPAAKVAAPREGMGLMFAERAKKIWAKRTAATEVDPGSDSGVRCDAWVM
jgi:hypothetical protein